MALPFGRVALHDDRRVLAADLLPVGSGAVKTEGAKLHGTAGALPDVSTWDIKETYPC